MIYWNTLRATRKMKESVTWLGTRRIETNSAVEKVPRSRILRRKMEEYFYIRVEVRLYRSV